MHQCPTKFMYTAKDCKPKARITPLSIPLDASGNPLNVSSHTVSRHKPNILSFGAKALNICTLNI